MSVVPRELREAITTAIARTDTPWALNRPKAMDRMRQAIQAAIGPIIIRALDEAFERGQADRYARAAEARAAGRAEGRRDALLEAATMLKRHGHRTAVDRVQALATPTAAPEPTEAPAEPPRPAHDPQNGTSGPTRNAPQEALEGTSEPRTPTEPPTDTATGPSAAPTGLQVAIDAASAAERENREREAWIGHAPSGHRRA